MTDAIRESQKKVTLVSWNAQQRLSSINEKIIATDTAIIRDMCEVLTKYLANTARIMILNPISDS
jgi:hypothetical protein